MGNRLAPGTVPRRRCISMTRLLIVYRPAQAFANLAPDGARSAAPGCSALRAAVACGADPQLLPPHRSQRQAPAAGPARRRGGGRSPGRAQAARLEVRVASRDLELAVDRAARTSCWRPSSSCFPSASPTRSCAIAARHPPHHPPGRAVCSGTGRVALGGAGPGCHPGRGPARARRSAAHPDFGSARLGVRGPGSRGGWRPLAAAALGRGHRSAVLPRALRRTPLLRESLRRAGRARGFADAAPGVVAASRRHCTRNSLPSCIGRRRTPPFRPSPRLPRTSPAAIAADSSLISVLRTSWRLPRRAPGRIGLAPVSAAGSRDRVRARGAHRPDRADRGGAGAQHEALLVLGAKRSEEPYTRDDRELLAAIAANLELLLERPEVPPPRPKEGFEECPVCGTCYDAGAGPARGGAELATVQHARESSRAGTDWSGGWDAGGMGAVYEATDSALEPAASR